MHDKLNSALAEKPFQCRLSRLALNSIGKPHSNQVNYLISITNYTFKKRICCCNFTCFEIIYFLSVSSVFSLFPVSFFLFFVGGLSTLCIFCGFCIFMQLKLQICRNAATLRPSPDWCPVCFMPPQGLKSCSKRGVYAIFIFSLLRKYCI